MSGTIRDVRNRLLRWQLWAVLALGGYLLVRAAMERDWIWVAFAAVFLTFHVYNQLTRPLPIPETGVVNAPRWVAVSAAVLALGGIVWMVVGVVPDYSMGSVLSVAVIAMLVYGTAYALLSLASRAARR
jgi:hypothetical protein